MKKKTRILFLLHLPPPIHGSSLIGQSIRSSILLNSSYRCSSINLLASKNIAESGQISLRKILGFVITFLKLLWNILFKRPKLCYLALTTSGAAFYRDLLIVSLLKLFRINRVYQLHNKGISLHSKKFIHRLSYRYVFNGADVIIASNSLYSDIEPFVPGSRLHICPYGMTDELKNGKGFSINDKESNKSNVQVLFLSNLIESKGVFILLKALALLNREKVAFAAVFIGGEGDVTSSRFEEQVKIYGLNNKVSYQGKKYGDEKIAAFKQADIFVLPTYYSKECFPLVLLEAMSYSLPAISTYEGGICDIVEEGITGFLVPKMNVELLASKLKLLIEQTEFRQNMGDQARRKFEQEFTIERFENRLLQILTQLI